MDVDRMFAIVDFLGQYSSDRIVASVVLHCKLSSEVGPC